MKPYPELYRAKPEPALLTVPPLPVLAVDGEGDPDGDDYRTAVQALFGVSYALRATHPDKPTVLPLEGRWPAVDGEHDITTVARDRWRWTMQIVQPPGTTADRVADAVAVARGKRPSAALDRLRLETVDEGRCAQVLHVGPYAQERPTIERLLAFVADRGLTVDGEHHEIYLSNPARTAPAKLKTIIRYPVA